jgi:hypothetical protein
VLRCANQTMWDQLSPHSRALCPGVRRHDDGDGPSPCLLDALWASGGGGAEATLSERLTSLGRGNLLVCETGRESVMYGAERSMPQQQPGAGCTEDEVRTSTAAAARRAP